MARMGAPQSTSAKRKCIFLALRKSKITSQHNFVTERYRDQPKHSTSPTQKHPILEPDRVLVCYKLGESILLLVLN
jgi:hypothetical protein